MRMPWRNAEEPGIAFSAAEPYLPERPIVVEAGAFTGEDVVEIQKVWPEAAVHAFEPVPATYSQLRKRVSGMDNVHTWPLALGVADGAAMIKVSSGPYGAASSSLLEPAEHLAEHPTVVFDESIEVEQRTLASWATAQGIESVDLLALDLQGMEHAVLEASAEFASRSKVIICEVFANEKYAGCGTVFDVQRTLSELNFVILRTNMFWGDSGDLLAVNAEQLQRGVA